MKSIKIPPMDVLYRLTVMRILSLEMLYPRLAGLHNTLKFLLRLFGTLNHSAFFFQFDSEFHIIDLSFPCFCMHQIRTKTIKQCKKT